MAEGSWTTALLASHSDAIRDHVQQEWAAKVAKLAKSASEARAGWLSHIADQPGGLLLAAHVGIENGGALPSMERAGLIERHKRSFFRLTPLGDDVRVVLEKNRPA